jgi:hypothetical protein
MEITTDYSNGSSWRSGNVAARGKNGGEGEAGRGGENE